MKLPVTVDMDGRTRAAKYKLHQNNYHNSARPHLSNSQISDYLRSPDYYYKKHVLGEIEDDIAGRKSIQRGQLVDSMLTENSTEPYQVKALRRDDPKLYEEQKQMNPDHLVTQSTWDEAEQIATDVAETEAWHELLDIGKPPVFQEILEGQVLNTQICGMADMIKEFDDTLALIDLKTTTNRTMDYWEKTCFERGYVRQLALYRDMLANEYGMKVTDIHCYHLVAAYVCEGLTRIEVFKFSHTTLNKAMWEIVDLIEKIENEEFDRPKVTFKDPTEIIDVWEK